MSVIEPKSYWEERRQTDGGHFIRVEAVGRTREEALEDVERMLRDEIRRDDAGSYTGYRVRGVG